MEGSLGWALSGTMFVLAAAVLASLALRPYANRRRSEARAKAEARRIAAQKKARVNAVLGVRQGQRMLCQDGVVRKVRAVVSLGVGDVWRRFSLDDPECTVYMDVIRTGDGDDDFQVWMSYGLGGAYEGPNGFACGGSFSYDGVEYVEIMDANLRIRTLTGIASGTARIRRFRSEEQTPNYLDFVQVGNNREVYEASCAEGLEYVRPAYSSDS